MGAIFCQYTPKLFLDVDGVLNAISRSGDRSVWKDWQSGVVTVAEEAWPILFSQTVIDSVRRWHEQELAQIFWLSDWGSYANEELGELLRLPAFPVLGAEQAAQWREKDNQFPDSYEKQWWKLEVLQDLVEDQADVALVWIDDDVRYQREARTWFEKGRNRLLVLPRTHLGITPKNLQEVELFLNGAADHRPSAWRQRPLDI